MNSTEKSQYLPLVGLVVTSLISSLVVLVPNLDPFLMFVPMILFAGYHLMPIIARMRYTTIVSAFVGFTFVIDNVAIRPWLDVVTITEKLGPILFYTLGFNGMELFSMGFLLWVFLSTSSKTHQEWLDKGLFKIALAASAILLLCLASGFYGISRGGTVKQFFIQARFFHLLPIWAVIGFCVFRSAKDTSTMLFVFSLAMLFKSVQAMVNYMANRGYFSLQEYLVDHYFSAFVVTACVFSLMHSHFYNYNIFQKGLIYLCNICAVVSFTLNDRRSSIVAIVLGFVIVLSFFQLSWFRKNLKVILLVVFGGLFITVVTWPLPAPFGFIGSTIRSLLISEDGVVTSRQIENFNLYLTISSHSFMGLGLGNEYHEAWTLPRIDHVYGRNQLIPHNTVLFFWAFGGPWGMAAVGTLFSLLFYGCGKVMRIHHDKNCFMVGIAGIMYMTQYLVFSYSDMAIQGNRTQMFAGLLFGCSIRILSEFKNYSATARPENFPTDSSKNSIISRIA